MTSSSLHRTLLPTAGPAALPLLLLALATLPSARAQLSFQVEPRVPVGECFNFWSIKNFTYQDLFDQPLGREAFRRNHPYTRYINCVRLIGGRGDGKNRWLLRVEADGRQVTDFTGMIRYLRAIQEWGYTPRIVLDNVPTELSAPGRPLHTYGNTYPPTDYGAYHRYLRAAVEAMVQAFGRETVGRWRFRVMTEPDLNPGHWAASKEEFLRLYDYAVDAVTQVLPEADIGPGNILNPVKHRKWGLDIIDHCATGRNYRTGQIGTRMRYFSCSWYGAVNEPVSSLTESVRSGNASASIPNSVIFRWKSPSSPCCTMRTSGATFVVTARSGRPAGWPRSRPWRGT
jgi:xylan 1,4-beta-xylosidase